MERIPLKFTLLREFGRHGTYMKHVILLCSSVGRIDIGMKQPKRLLLGVSNSVFYYLCLTIQTSTIRECRFKLELEWCPSHHGNRIALNVSVCNTGTILVLGRNLYEITPKPVETSRCLTEDFKLCLTDTSYSLDFQVELRLSKEPQRIRIESGNATQETFTALNTLSNDFRKFLEDESTSDVALKCGSDTLFAHKLILSARSPVFQAMFKNEMLENRTGIVEINDISAQTVRTMLCYIYCGKFEEFTISTACEGLHASEKYQFPEMKQACIDFLKCSMSNDVALSVLKFADIYDKGLMEYIIDYICRNFQTIQTSESWNSFEKDNPPLAFLVLKKIINFLQK